MTILKSAIALVLVLSWRSEPKAIYSYSLQGTVSHKESGKPLADVYLYTVKGEEETLTNQKGEFKIVTWQKLPITIHVRSLDDSEVKVVVNNPANKISIKL